LAIDWYCIELKNSHFFAGGLFGQDEDSIVLIAFWLLKTDKKDAIHQDRRGATKA